MKPLNLYKHIAILLAILFSIFTISCSSISTSTTVLETKLSETTQASKTTVIETTTTIEITTTAEAEIINAPEIAGLRFDQATKTYLAEAGNPYGLEAGVEAGVYTKEAIRVNGEMEDAIGLKPEIIDYFQKEYIKNSDCFFPLIFNLNEIKGIEIEESNITLDKDIDWLGVKVPEGTRIYTPLSTNDTLYGVDVDNYFELYSFVSFNKERMMGIIIYSKKKYSLMDSKEVKEDRGWAKIFNLKVGELVAQIDQKVALSASDAEEDYNRKYDLLYAIVTIDKKVNFFDKMLAFDGKKLISYLVNLPTTRTNLKKFNCYK